MLLIDYRPYGNLLSDKIKWKFFKAILLYRCPTWTLMKCLEKNLNGNNTRMLHAVLKKSWKQHPTKQLLFNHLPPIYLTIQVRQTRHSEHCWKTEINSSAKFFYELPHMDTPLLVDQQKLIFISSLQTLDAS